MPQEPMTFQDFEIIAHKVTFRDWWLILNEETEAFTLQWAFMAPDNDNPGGPVEQHGRKWRVSRFSTEGEVVQTALLAAFTAVEHEVREEFKYLGAPIFNTHLDLEALLSIADSTIVRS